MPSTRLHCRSPGKRFLDYSYTDTSEKELHQSQYCYYDVKPGINKETINPNPTCRSSHWSSSYQKPMDTVIFFLSLVVRCKSVLRTPLTSVPAEPSCSLEKPLLLQLVIKCFNFSGSVTIFISQSDMSARN